MGYLGSHVLINGFFRLTRTDQWDLCDGDKPAECFRGSGKQHLAAPLCRALLQPIFFLLQRKGMDEGTEHEG